MTALLLLLGIAVVGSVVPAPLVSLGPGPTVNTLDVYQGKQVVSAAGLRTYPTSGHLNMTTVGVTDGITAFQALREWFSSDHQLVPRYTIYPPGLSDQQVTSANQLDFDSSVANAEAAALTYLKMPTRVTVGGLVADSPSAGVLAEGDQIVAVSGRPVSSVPMLLEILKDARPGVPVTMQIKRGDDPVREVSVTPGAYPGDPGRAFLGITPATAPAAGDRLSITLGDVGGPSAGLMFALALVDKLTPGALTGGRFIAGTGTITPEGVVGPISGIRFKMLKASEVGAQTFLVPADNCAEAAAKAPDGLALARVATVGDAVTALDTIRAGGTPRGCS